MESYLRARGIRLFDFPKFAMPYRDEKKEDKKK